MNEVAAVPSLADRQRRALCGLILVMAVSILYSLTLQTGINGSSDRYAEDVGEFQNVLTQWGTAHPTGYPLYSLTGAAITAVLIFLGMPPAAAASAFSMLLTILTLVGVYVLLVWIDVQPALAAGTAVLLGAVFPFWYHAVVAEVYALLIGLMVLAFLIAVRWRAERRPGRLYALAFVSGLAVGHHRLAVLMMPALLVMIGPVLLTTLRERPVRLLGALFSLAAAFSIYLYLPLRARTGGTWIYGQPGTWNGFWAIALAREYGALVRPMADLNQAEAGFTQVISVLADSVTWPLLIAGALGLIVALKKVSRRWLALSQIALLATNLAFAGIFSRAVFLPAALMPAMVSVILGVGLLAQLLTERWRIGTGMAVIALSLAAILFIYNNGPTIYRMTHDSGGQQIIDGVKAAEVDRVTEHPVVMALWGRDYFALAYAHNVTGELARVEMVDHRADVDEVVASGQTLYVLRPTFYLRPLDWWDTRLGHAYLSSFEGDLVRVSDRPVLKAADVPGVRPVPMAPDIALRDWQVKSLPDRRWLITLFWQADARPDRNYSVFLHASDKMIIDGPADIVAQDDSSAPVYGWYPTSRWSSGEIVRDDHSVVSPIDRPAKIVAVGLYTQDAAGHFQNYGQQIIALP